MPETTVLVELFAVIGGHYDNRILVEPFGVELGQELSELNVEVFDLAAIELVKSFGHLRLGFGHRHARDSDAVIGMLEVGIVGVHVVKEEKEAFILAIIEPIESDLVYDFGVLIEVVEVNLVSTCNAEPNLTHELVDDELRARFCGVGDVVRAEVVVVVVALGKAEALGKIDIRNDAAGRVATRLHGLGDQGQVAGKARGFRHRSVRRGQRGGEQRCGRRLRPRSVGERLIGCPTFCQPTEIRCLDFGSIAREVIGAERIDHDEDDVRFILKICGDAGDVASGARRRRKDH